MSRRRRREPPPDDTPGGIARPLEDRPFTPGVTGPAEGGQERARGRQSSRWRGVNWGLDDSGPGGFEWFDREEAPGTSPGPAGEPDPGGNDRPRPPRRRSPAALIGPLAGAVGLAILLGAGVYALTARGCSEGGLPLKIAATPDIAPAVSRISAAFNDRRHMVDGKCVRAVVRSSDSASTTTLLSGQGTLPGETAPDVWIPDSSLWVTLVRSTPTGAATVSATPTSVARSPLVAATTRAFNARIRGDGIQPTWDMLLRAADALVTGTGEKPGVLPAHSVHLQILDPTRSAGGLGAAVMVHTLLQGDPNANTIFSQIMRKAQTSISPNTQALFTTLQQNLRGPSPVVIAPEQSVWAYNRSHPPVPASAIYPSEGMLSLDYPYTLTTHDDAKVRAAETFERAVTSGPAASEVHALGFRTPDGHFGRAIAPGLSPRLPRALPSPAPGEVSNVLQAWSKLSLRSRMLALVDVSGSMAEPVGKGVSRLQATAQVAQAGLSLLPDDTDVGIWAFSTNLRGAQDYRTEVPTGPLGSRLGTMTRRQAVFDSLGRLRPKVNGDTGLYDSVLAAFRSAQQTYRAGYYNTVLVLTDGHNDDPAGISLDGLLGTLRKENDPARPVMVIFIGFGPAVDMAAMQRIAAQTNGMAYHAMRPQEIQRIFQDAIARRICAPQCH